MKHVLLLLFTAIGFFANAQQRIDTALLKEVFTKVAEGKMSYFMSGNGGQSGNFFDATLDKAQFTAATNNLFAKSEDYVLSNAETGDEALYASYYVTETDQEAKQIFNENVDIINNLVLKNFGSKKCEVIEKEDYVSMLMTEKIFVNIIVEYKGEQSKAFLKILISPYTDKIYQDYTKHVKNTYLESELK